MWPESCHQGPARRELTRSRISPASTAGTPGLSPAPGPLGARGAAFPREVVLPDPPAGAAMLAAPSRCAPPAGPGVRQELTRFQAKTATRVRTSLDEAGRGLVRPGGRGTGQGACARHTPGPARARPGPGRARAAPGRGDRPAGGADSYRDGAITAFPREVPDGQHASRPPLQPASWHVPAYREIRPIPREWAESPYPGHALAKSCEAGWR